MKKYKKLLQKALPYYKKGRKGDIEHIKWLYKTVPKFIDKHDKQIDLDILMPVVILHDVGYSKVPKNSDPFNLNIRKLHSLEGAKIAEKILTQLKYSKNKIKTIKKLIKRHDDWAFGKNFLDEPVLQIFNNFDFIWIYTKKGFDIVRKFTKQNKKDFYKQSLIFYKDFKDSGRKFYSKKIKQYFKHLIKQRKRDIS